MKFSKRLHRFLGKNSYKIFGVQAVNISGEWQILIHYNKDVYKGD